MGLEWLFGYSVAVALFGVLAIALARTPEEAAESLGRAGAAVTMAASLASLVPAYLIGAAVASWALVRGGVPPAWAGVVSKIALGLLLASFLVSLIRLIQGRTRRGVLMGFVIAVHRLTEVRRPAPGVERLLDT